MHHIQGTTLISGIFKKILNLHTHISMPAFTILRLSFLLSLALFITPIFSNASAAEQKIMIVHQASRDFSQQLIHQLEKELSSSGYQTESMMLNEQQFDTGRLKTQQLLIAIGSKTTRTLLEHKLEQPILSLLIPMQIADSFKMRYPEQKNWASLVIDQPVDRQFHLITQILGKQKQVGVLLGPNTMSFEQKLSTAARKTGHKITLEPIENSDQLSTSLKALKNKTDVLLTLADPVIYNKNTIRGILLLSYRNRLPIIGFSSAYVKAGAIAAVYSEPVQISEQAARITGNYFQSSAFTQTIFYPDEFSISVNNKVARSLGIRLPENTSIIKQIKKAERTQ